MKRSKTGEAISAGRRTPEALEALVAFIEDAHRRGDLGEWRRGIAVRSYIAGERVTAIHRSVDVVRGTVNQWLRWYETMGLEGLRTWKQPGAARRLSDSQREELAAIVEAGPMAAGFTTGVWTGPMVGDVIAMRFGVRYHNQHVPRLLHQLGFSVQRPRKRLARADAEAQAAWLRDRLPDVKKGRGLPAES